ncbi:AraC family transcriptional regulator [Bacterioplanoides sp. SCSIO 12839]|uniref:AraC family transcriptional regulator n=1 Tax=Bacterioplanoides sp. SCSIO 12839 TaxID=2829569 RepID=UPI002104DF75|nr:AraC family transcriptional regulator [Bacterioplanoides sp. SCSIO 12839]UTW47349.1 AraC family transcriptional regulator ligand-binding domain-containing protein [Bacterioplanoides sp. SCSIO 12839]
MSQRTPNTMATAALQPLFRLLESKGYASSELLKSIGLNSNTISTTQRISIHDFDRLLEHCSHLIDEPAIGLAAGQRLELPNFYLLGFLISSCQSGREVLAILRRYYSLISDSRSPDFYIGQESIKVLFYVSEGQHFGSQARAEFVAAGIHSIGKAIGGSYYRLKGIGFRSAPPSYRHKLEEYFGVPIEYNQPQNWISTDSKHLDSPLMYANPMLVHTLRSQAEDNLSRFSHLQAFSRKVMYVLHQWPESVAITKTAVAALLNTSSRTLTRRLQEEDCQFSTLVKEVRLEKAKQALEQDSADVQQLALDLGFSDRRGFERAFKQWTGETPAAYRRNYRNQGAPLERMAAMV